MSTLDRLTLENSSATRRGQGFDLLLCQSTSQSILGCLLTATAGKRAQSLSASDRAREAVGVETSVLQMRDFPAKAGTDKAKSNGDIMRVKDQLGLATMVMTEQ